MLRNAFPIFASLILYACDSEIAQFDRPSTIITGVASDALIVDGFVKVYPSKGGSSVASTRTNADGSFILSDLKIDSGYYRFEITGGHYEEEASGQKVSLGVDHSLDSLMYVEPGNELQVTISPLSSLHYDYTQCLISQGKLENNADREAATQLASMYEFNVTSVSPFNITHSSSDNVFSSPYKYGFIQAARSQKTLEINSQNGLVGHSGYSSIDFAMAARTDLQSDCVLNGMDGQNQISFGNYDFSVNTYRSELAAALIGAANSEYNNTAFKPEDVLSLANTISTNTERIYGSGEIQEFDLDGPTITFTNRTGERIVGESFVPIRLHDRTDIGLVQFFIDDQLQAEYFGEDSLSLRVDTSILEDGPHDFTVVAQDIIGNQSTKTLSLITSNFAIPYTLMSSTQVNTSTYSVDIQFEESTETVEALSINNVEAIEFYDHWRLTTQLEPGLNSLVLEIQTNERSVQEIVEVCYDDEPPSIDLIGSNALLKNVASGQDSFGPLVSGDTDNWLLITPDTYSLGNNSTDSLDLDDAHITYIEAQVEDSTYGCEDTPIIDFRFRKNGEWVTDWSTVPEEQGLSVNLPFVEEWIGDDLLRSRDDDSIDLYVVVTDQAGNEKTASFRTNVSLFFDKVIIDTKYIDLNVVSAYEYELSRGPYISDCHISEGLCSLNVVSPAELIELQISSVRYVEPYGNTIVYSENSISGMTAMVSSYVRSMLNPFSNIYFSMVKHEISDEKEIDQALNQASTKFVDLFGFHPVDSSHSGRISNHSNVPGYIQLALKTLSEVAHSQYSGFTPTQNSVSLSEIMARDLEDGTEDSSYYGEQLFIDGQHYSSEIVKAQFASLLLENAYDQTPHLIDDVIDISKNLHEPLEPTISINLAAGVKQGYVNIVPEVVAETEYILVAYIDGDEVYSGNGGFTIDTTLLEDGIHSLRIDIEDRYRHKASDTASFISDNLGPVITRVSDVFESESSYSLELDISDENALDTNIRINGENYPVVDGTNVFSFELTGNYNVFDIELYDVHGNQTLDRASVLKIPSAFSEVWNGVVSIFESEPISSDSTIGLEADSRFINSYDFGDAVDVNSNDISDGNHSLNFHLIDDIGILHSVSRNILVDNTGPSIQFQTGKVLVESPYTISISTNDVYSEVGEVTVEGQVIEPVAGLYNYGPLVRDGDFNEISIQATDSIGNNSSMSTWIATPELPSEAVHGVFRLTDRLPIGTSASVQVADEFGFANQNEYLEVDLDEISSGSQEILFSFANESEESSTVTLGSIIVDNDQPIIDVLPAKILTAANDSEILDVFDVHSKLATTAIKGAPVAVVDGEYSQEYTFTPTYDYSELTIEAVDNVGLSNSIKVAVIDARNVESLDVVAGNITLLDMTPWISAVGEVDVFINDIPLSTPLASSPWTFVSEDYEDGNAELRITNKHKNFADSEVEFMKTITIDNSGPDITLSSDLIETDHNFSVSLVISEPYSNISGVTVNGYSLGSTAPFESDVFARTGDFLLVNVQATDTVGNLNSRLIRIVTPELPTGYHSNQVRLLSNIPSDSAAVATIEGQSSSAISGEDLYLRLNDVSSGSHPVSLSYSNNIDGSYARTIGELLVDNDKPNISVPRALINTSVNSTETVISSDQHSGLASLTIDGMPQTITGGQFNGATDFSTTSDFDEIQIAGIDNVGNLAEASIVVLDVSSIESTNFYSGSYSLFDTTPQVESVGTVNVLMNTAPVVRPNPGEEWILETTDYSDGSHELFVEIYHQNGESASFQKTITIDNSIPSFSGSNILFLTNSVDSYTFSIADDETGLNFASFAGDALALSNDSYSGSVQINQLYDYAEYEIQALNNLGLSTTETIASVDVSRIENMSTISGIVTLLDQTPWGSAISTVDIEIDNVALLKPNSSNPWILDSSEFDDGTHQIDLTVSHSNGMTSTYNHSFIIDNSIPTISVTSADLTGESDYTLTGSSIDGFSSIDSLTVNDTVVSINNDGSWEFPVLLSNGITNFDIEAIDEAGNQGSQHFAVSYDYLPPILSSNSSDLRRWISGNVVYLNGTSNSDLGNLLLYPEYRTTQADFGDIDSLDDSMWVDLQFFDGQDGNSYRHSADELMVSYRYLIDGVQQFSWKILDIDIDAKAKLALDTNTLGNALYFSEPGSVHELEFRMSDPLGKENTSSLYFNVEKAVSGDLGVSTSINEALENVQLTELDSTISAGNLGLSDVTLSNPYDFGIWVKVKNISAISYADRIHQVSTLETHGFFETKRSWEYITPEDTCERQELLDGNYIWVNGNVDNTAVRYDGEVADIVNRLGGVSRFVKEFTVDELEWTRQSHFMGQTNFEVINDELITQTSPQIYSEPQSVSSVEEAEQFIYSYEESADVGPIDNQSYNLMSQRAVIGYLMGNLFNSDTLPEGYDPILEYDETVTSLINGDPEYCESGIWSIDRIEFVETPGYPRETQLDPNNDSVFGIELSSTGFNMGDYVYLNPGESITVTTQVSNSQSALVVNQTPSFGVNAKQTSDVTIHAFNNILYSIVVIPESADPAGLELSDNDRNAVSTEITHTIN